MTAPALDYGSGGRIGVLLPSVNQAAEPQLRAMLPADIAIAVTRLKLVDSSEASLLGMARDVEPAAELLADAGVDIVVFHCTAVSTYSTELEASILARIQSATGLPCVATSQALVAALQAKDVPAAESLSAGSFVCNHLFYGLMHALRRRRSVQAGFVHLPWLPEQVAERPRAFALPLDTQVRAVQHLLATALQWRGRGDLQRVGGALD